MRYNFAYWLRTEPVESVMPRFDKCIVPILKIGYLSVRILLRLCLGKKRRDEMKFYRRLYVGDYTVPSYDVTRFFYKLFKHLKIGSPKLLKVYAKEYRYRYYCRLEDFEPGREEDIIKLFRPKEGDIVVDVGAHVGRYTIIASKMVGPRGKVIAIEAHPGTYEILKKNISLNNLNNVVALNYAVHSRKTVVKLYEPEQEEGHTIRNTIMTDRTMSNNQNYIEVKADTLDSLLAGNGIKEVNWIKIDVEGAEYEVLIGASTILSNSKDIACLIEVHNLGHKNKNFYGQIIHHLGSKNYNILFEKTYGSGERHIIMKRSQLITS
ncbi:MAG: FkbM family methyltransferase [Nitrososphaeraceae archaeon]